MTLRTAFTELLGLRHPVALAPMGGSAGGALAAAVSNAGGLGLLGGGNGDRDWLTRELPIVAGGTRGPWGVGFQSWAVDRGTVELALESRPSAVMLSFGDPRPLAEPARASGATLIIVADLAAPVPVLAAGGIADGRGVAAALALGGAGALVGTRLLATAEALADPAAKKAIVDGSGEDTERSSVLDIARGSRWPREYTGRTMAHPVLDEWRDREDELAASAQAKSDYRRRVDSGEFPPQPVWASQAIDLISDLPPAADVIAGLAAQAEDALARILSR